MKTPIKNRAAAEAKLRGVASRRKSRRNKVLRQVTSGANTTQVLQQEIQMLGSLLHELSENRSLIHREEGWRTHHFVSPRHKRIYSALKRVIAHGKPVSVAAIGQELRHTGRLREGDREYMTFIVNRAKDLEKAEKRIPVLASHAFYHAYRNVVSARLDVVEVYDGKVVHVSSDGRHTVLKSVEPGARVPVGTVLRLR